MKKSRVLAILLCICLVLQAAPYKAYANETSPSVLKVQMVPCGQKADGSSTNGWTDFWDCKSGEINHLASRVNFGEAPASGDVLNYFFMKCDENTLPSENFTIHIENARVETSSGQTISLDGLNGTYPKPIMNQYGSYTISEYSRDNIAASLLYQGMFKAEITVNFGDISEYGTTTELFPSKGLVSYDANTIILDNVTYTGTLDLTGGTKYKNGINLVIKGECNIDTLKLSCSVKLIAPDTASLRCRSLIEGSYLSTFRNISRQDKDTETVFTAVPMNLGHLADISYTGSDKSLPGNNFYSVNGDTITLKDFHFDGSIDLTGGGYERLKLILKGTNSIGSLKVNCPISIERYSYASLTCGTYTANQAVTLDENTGISTVGTNKVIGFALSAGHSAGTLYDTESNGFAFVKDSNQKPICSTNSSNLQQYAETTVNNLPGIQNGYSMTFSAKDTIYINTSDGVSACVPEEKVIFSFYARILSEPSGADTYIRATIKPRNLNAGTYGEDFFRWSGNSIAPGSEWKQFFLSGHFPSNINNYTHLSIALGCNTPGSKIEFAGVRVYRQNTMTASEMDEFTGIYDYSWRHQDASWRGEAADMQTTNRKGDLHLNVKDKNGNKLNGATVTVAQTGYAYDLGDSSAAYPIIDYEGHEGGKLIDSLNRGMNAIIDYCSNLMQYYYDDGKEDTDFDFDRTQFGDADFVTAAVKMCDKYNVKYVAQPLIYPSFALTRGNDKHPNNYDALIEYVLSSEYSPQGFKQYLNDHITKVVTSYAGVIRNWAVVNEAYYSKDFFKLIYGTDGNGISKEQIASVTNGYGNSESKIDALEKWLENQVPIAPASAAGKYIAEFSDTAMKAWTDAECDEKDLFLYYNDAATKYMDGLDGEYYAYVTNLAKELAKPENYKGGKVLIDAIGFQFADWKGNTISPAEVWSLLEEYKQIGFPIFLTEYNYFLDNPVSSQGSQLSDYGTNYQATDCASKAEKEFIYDYAEAIYTSMYSHSNSTGIFCTSYPHGQIGFYYEWGHTTPIYEALTNLMQKQWHTETKQGQTVDGAYNVTSATRGTYEVTVEYGGAKKTYQVKLDGQSATYDLKTDVVVTHKMSFSSQGGSTVASQDVEENGTATKPEDPTREGYTFEGWYKEAESVNPWNFATDVMPARDITLYAKWRTNAYTISFNGNGGTGNMNSQAMTYGIEKELPDNTFAREGYTFVGWARSETGNKEYENKQKVKNLTNSDGTNITLYAKWRANAYTIQFNANGGTGTMNSQAMTYGSESELSSNTFTREGYTFVGWALSETGEVEYDNKETVKNLTSSDCGTVTLYAKWKTKDYTIVFDNNGGAGEMDSQAMTFDRESELFTNQFTRTGYSFDGWALSESGEVVYEDNEKVKNLTNNQGATITMYAKWKANPYTIEFNSNGGTGSMNSQAMTYDSESELSANTFTREGYTFIGWARSGAGNVVYKNKASVTNLTSTNGDTVTLYAIWKVNAYTIRFSANGGTGKMSNQAMTYNSTKPLFTNLYKRTGYTFMGWARSSKGSVVYKNKVSIKNLTSTNGATVYLYAVWKANTYKVKFSTNGGKGKMSSQTMTYNSTKALSSNLYKRTGYTFSGWARSSKGKIVYKNKASIKNLTSTNGATITLYAIWKANTYTVKFSANGGKGKMSSQTMTYNSSKAIKKNTFTRKGYKFAGWSLKKSSKVKYKNKAKVKNLTSTKSGTITLYAKWTKK